MREDLIEQITSLLISKGCYQEGVTEELTIILADYEVAKRSTEVMVVDEDENIMLVKKFITAKIVKGLSERTLKYYKDTIDFFLRRVQKNITEVTSDDIRLYIAIRKKRDHVTDTTAGNELRNLRSFYNWLYMEELIKTNPIAKVEPMKKAKTKKEAFTEIEVELIRQQCSTERERAIVELLLSTGCRVSELVHIKRGEVKDGAVLVHGKGNKDRTVYLNARAQIALQKYMEEREDKEEWIFPGSVNLASEKGCTMRKYKEQWYKHAEAVIDKPIDIATIEQLIRNLGKRAGVPNVHPHRFRRTCATFALRRGMPIEQVSKMLGHESIETTQIYLDLSEKDLEQAHRKYVV